MLAMCLTSSFRVDMEWYEDLACGHHQLDYAVSIVLEECKRRPLITNVLIGMRPALLSMVNYA